MRKTGFSMLPLLHPGHMFSEMEPGIMAVLFGKFLEFANKLEEQLDEACGLSADQEHFILWALRWNSHSEDIHPNLLPSLSATVSLCTKANIPRALNEFHSQVKGCRMFTDGDRPKRTETVVISVAEAPVHLLVTSKKICDYTSRMNEEQILSSIIELFAESLGTVAAGAMAAVI